MLKTYPALIVDGHVEWLDQVPPESSSGPMKVEVAVVTLPVHPLSDDERRQRLRALFEKMKLENGFASIPDPVAWQRELRKDRPLMENES